jgi:TPR repeat protein
MLSLLYQFGYSVQQDAASAEQWLIRAAEQQSALAWNNLGTLYLMGLPGVPYNPGKALECYLCWRRELPARSKAATPDVTAGFHHGLRVVRRSQLAKLPRTGLHRMCALARRRGRLE